MGFINRAAIVTGPGTVIAKDDFPTAEDILAQKEKIWSLKKGKEYFHVGDQVGDVLAAFTSPPEDVGESTKKFASVEAIFSALPDSFVPEAAEGVDVVFQYHISGEGGGDWHCVVKDKACTVDAGTHDKPICTLKMGSEDFLSMMNGDMPAMQAYTSGKLKIEGDIMKSQLIEKLFKIT
jgi:putative sterol carrier protein